MKNSRALISVLACLALFLPVISCATAVGPGIGGAVSHATFEEVMGRLGARTQSLSSLKTLMDIRLKGAQSMTATLSWTDTDRLRFSVYNFFGQTLFEVTVAEERVQWSEPGRPPVILGSIESVMLSKPIHREEYLPISIEDMVRLSKVLTGPVLEEGEYPVMETTESYYVIHGMRISGEEAKLTRRFWINRNSFQLEREEFFGDDYSPRLVLSFFEYKETEQGNWPHRMLVEGEDAKHTVELVFREFKFNEIMDPGEFQVVGKVYR